MNETVSNNQNNAVDLEDIVDEIELIICTPISDAIIERSTTGRRKFNKINNGTCECVCGCNKSMSLVK